MIRIITLAALLAMAVPAVAQVADPRIVDSPRLKSEVAVSSELVRIGDLVENAGAVGDIAIFRAPDLGETGTVPVARVVEAMRAHHVIGLDIGDISEVTVKRSSRTISAKDIEARVARALASQRGAPDRKDLAVTFDNEVRALQVESTATTELQISRLSYEPRSGRFDVSLDLPGSAIVRRTPLRVTGTAVETAEAAVLVRSLERGEIMRAADLVIEPRPKSEVGDDVVTTSAPAVGRSARRALRAGQVIHQADLMRPELVQRNDIVTIVYEMPGMMLTVRGKAIDSGAEGDIINVTNVQSKRNIQATVTGPGRVSVVTIAPTPAPTATFAASALTDTTGTTTRPE
jgi:flagella basal body P-ring formation protein FlgA